MIRFFRQIRQRLLTDNKFSKYLLYAVGEVLLVVIGILIALQIDNWNDQRKLRNLEIKTLKELSSDLRQSFTDIEADRNYFLSCSASSQVIMNVIKENLPFTDSLNDHFSMLFPAGATFSINQSTFDNIKQTGESMISSDSLRIHVTNFYTSWVNLYKERQNRFLVLHHEHTVKPMFLTVFEFKQRGKITPRNYDELLRNEEFEQLIRYTNFEMENIARVQKAMLDEIRILVDEINDELIRLE